MVFEKFSLVILSKHEQALIQDPVAGQSIPEYVDRTSKHDRATAQREKTEVQITMMSTDKQEQAA